MAEEKGKQKEKPLAGPYMDLLTDYGFKRLFCQEGNKPILLHFINALFQGQKEMVGLTLKPTEHGGNHTSLKSVAFDLHFTGNEDDLFIVEMQRKNQSFYVDRCIFYSARKIDQQLDKSKTSKKYHLKQVNFIAMVEFELNFIGRLEGDKRYLHDFSVTHKDTGELFSNNLTYKFVELCNFVKEEQGLVTDLDIWLYY